MKCQGAPIDARLGVLFVLRGCTVIQDEMIPYAVGFDRVLSVGYHHVPVLDDGLFHGKSQVNDRHAGYRKHVF